MRLFMHIAVRAGAEAAFGRQFEREVEGFLTAISQVSIGAEAIADEEKFVDRPNSLDFCFVVDWQG